MLYELIVWGVLALSDSPPADMGVPKIYMSIPVKNATVCHQLKEDYIDKQNFLLKGQMVVEGSICKLKDDEL